MRTKKCPNPRCHSAHIVANGRYWSDARGYTKRWICRDCGNKWKVFEEPLLQDLPALDIRIPLPAVLRRLALVALGLPLQVVEKLEYVKAETVRAQILRFHSDENLWGAICGLLISECGIPAARVEEFSTALDHIAAGTRTFHTLARAYRRLIRKQESRHALAEQSSRLLRRPVQISQTGQVQVGR
jgi:transposase-like protein